MVFAQFTDAQIEYAFAQKMQLDTIKVIEADDNNRVVIEELHFQDLLPTMNKYTRDYYATFNNQLSALQLVEVQRDRLNYLYEMNQENLIHSLMPNAVSVATVAFSTRNILSSIIAIAGTALSSISSYASQEDLIELEYIQQNWDLDDQEKMALDALASELYLYKCDIGSSLGIGREQALSSSDLKDFVDACNESSPATRYSRLSRLESRLNTLPDYWREMAKAAYELERYAECLSYLEKYEEYYVPIFFHDNDHASAMMIKAFCIMETYEGDDKVHVLNSIADEILENIQDSDWIRYIFCAELFDDLYVQFGDIEYLQKAYDCYISVLYSKIKEFNKNTSDYVSGVYVKKGLDSIDAEIEVASYELSYAKKDRNSNISSLWGNWDYYKNNIDKAQTKVDELKAKRDNFELLAGYELPPDDSYIISIFNRITKLAEELGITDSISYESVYDMIDEAIYNVYSRNLVFGEEIPFYDCSVGYEHNTVFSDSLYVMVPLYQLQYLGDNIEDSSVYDTLLACTSNLTLTIDGYPFDLYPVCYIYNPGTGNIRDVCLVLYTDGIGRFEGNYSKDAQIQNINIYIYCSCFSPLDIDDGEYNLWNIPKTMPEFQSIVDNIKYEDAFLGIF